jgi:NDP-sugar pyrophosphorylase family protein
MKRHVNGGGQVADTARVEGNCYIGEDCIVKDNAVVIRSKILNGSVIAGNAVIQDSEIDNAHVGGTAEVKNACIHGNVTLTKTPVFIFGFPQPVVVAESFIIIGCQTILIEDWQTRSLALLRSEGYPKKSAIRIRDSIDVVHRCYLSLYDEEDIKDAFSM